MSKEKEKQLKSWISWYSLIDTDTALKRAVKKVFKGVSPQEQDKICKDYKSIQYGF